MLRLWGADDGEEDSEETQSEDGENSGFIFGRV